MTSSSGHTILLDTNVISEIVKPNPDQFVATWYFQQDPASLYTTAVTLAETLFGLSIMPEGSRRDNLTSLCHVVFDGTFRGKILPFDEPAARYFAQLRSEKRRRGLTMESLDAQIAAIALVAGASIATRNTVDFEHCGVPIINPWRPAPY